MLSLLDLQRLYASLLINSKDMVFIQYELCLLRDKIAEAMQIEDREVQEDFEEIRVCIMHDVPIRYKLCERYPELVSILRQKW